MYEYFVYMSVQAPHMCLVLMEARRGNSISWNGMIMKPPCGCWEPEQGPLQE